MYDFLKKQLYILWSNIVTLWLVFTHMFKKKDTVEYPDVMPYMFPRWRGRIILSRDPDGEERCVACNLCAVACPVDCIALQKTEDAILLDTTHLTIDAAVETVLAHYQAVKKL